MNVGGGGGVVIIADVSMGVGAVVDVGNVYFCVCE